jgi:nucleoid DNA-binding protein
MNISAYILEYLKQFGSVVVPGFGVFSLENSKAIINSDNGSILPPASQIAFTPDYEIESEELAAFIAAQKQMPLGASKSDLKIQTDFWKKKLQADQILEIQNLGKLSIHDDHIIFSGKRLENDHPDFYGLEEIRISDIKNSEKKEKPTTESKKDYKFNKSILWTFLFVIPVLGIAYAGYSQQELIFGKKSFDSISVQTKTKRIETIVPIKKDSATLKVSDTLKKDSLRKDSIIKPAAKMNKSTAPKKKSKWQK